ncbi:hypothetical protein CsSME_00047878 [Camellia sinensis var. sinensis]
MRCLQVPMEKKRELIQNSLKLCLSNGVKNMTLSHNVTVSSKVLERSHISKNIEGLYPCASSGRGVARTIFVGMEDVYQATSSG